MLRHTGSALSRVVAQPTTLSWLLPELQVSQSNHIGANAAQQCLGIFTSRDGDSCQAAPAQTSALVTFSPACHEVASTPSSCTALDQRRSFSLAYARMLERDYNYRNDVVDMYGQLTDYLIKVVPKWIRFGVAGPAQSNTGSYQEPTLYTDPEYIVPLCRFLRDHVNTQYKCMIDITAVDFPERPKRFEVVYHFLSPRWNNRIRIKVCVDELTPVPSICSVYKAANWFERETWDMFGVFFSDHPDLRRILTDYGFTGHPLRKDFPLTGFTEMRYDYSKKRVISEPVELTQEFRYFDFQSPWETLPR
eukprot:jgi/Chrzof1/10950/Cz05g18120.t1